MKLLLLTAVVVAASLTLPGPASAKPWWKGGVESNENDFLPPDAAFRVSAQVQGNVLRIRWAIADGYYLYRHAMEVDAESPDLALSEPSFPKGALKTDPYLGTQEIFTQQVEATVPYSRVDAGARPIQIRVTYQGCAEAGLCYTPISKVIFPDIASPVIQAPPHPWEGYAIVGGGLAFLLAGLLLRKGRRLDSPA